MITCHKNSKTDFKSFWALHPLTNFSSMLGSGNVVDPTQSSVTNATAEDLHEHTSEATSNTILFDLPAGNLLQVACELEAMAHN